MSNENLIRTFGNNTQEPSSSKTNGSVEILQAIETLTTDNGIAPTVEQVAEAIGSKNLIGLTFVLDCLERNGYIESLDYHKRVKLLRNWKGNPARLAYVEN